MRSAHLSRLLVLCAPLAGACFLQQQLDEQANSAINVPVSAAGTGGAGSPGAGGSGAMPSETGGSGGSGPASLDCAAVNGQARTIREKDCAYCHQQPAKMGNFDFILNDQLLMMANSTAGNKFIVAGNPESSRIYQRVSANEMPPAGMMPRPTKDDVALLRVWINTCVASGPSSGPGGPPGPDAGPPNGGPDPGAGCGGTGQDCCNGNVCNSGGCCVQGECRANGAACNDGPGTGGVPGMCVSSSCVNAGAACGALTQACCQGATCTAERTYCGSMSAKCEVCGGVGQACCGTGGDGTCLAGLDCQGARYPLNGSCKPCGGLNQPCCGNGPTATQKCDMALRCQFDIMRADSICVM